MLHTLHLKNLGLITEEKFSFHKGFTSITGETGSGKTSLIDALNLTLGKKSDFDLIKQGSDLAFVEAIFELENRHPLYLLLQTEGLTIEAGEPIILKRLLYKEGKSKAFINHQTVPVHFLSKIAPYLVHRMDQEALFTLQKPHFYEELIDTSGHLENRVLEYGAAFKNLKEIENQLSKLEKLLPSKQLQMERLEEEISELTLANVQPQEETTLFAAYKKAQASLSQVEKLSTYVNELSDELLPKLKKMSRELAFNPSLNHPINTAFEALCEVSLHLETTLEKDLISDACLKQMENRLNTLHKLSKKYGLAQVELSEVLGMKKKEQQELFQLEDALIECKAQKDSLLVIAKDLGLKLSLQRKTWASQLSKSLEESLKPLNMPFVELAFDFTECPLSINGLDAIDLLIKTNPGSPKIPLLQGASGGELARINFCFFLERVASSTAGVYLFDEIDAHVGGTTSAIMGEKLKGLAKHKQVFCITHFAQMAACADNHLGFTKKQDKDTTTITFNYSQEGPLSSEIERMIGLKE